MSSCFIGNHWTASSLSLHRNSSLFNKNKVDWSCMIEDKVVLLFFILVFRVWITHNVDISSTVINVHNIVYDFHILTIFSSWIPLVVVSLLAILHVVILVICLRLTSILSSSITFISIIICLIGFHIDLIAQFLGIICHSLLLVTLSRLVLCVLSCTISSICKFKSIFNWWLPYHLKRTNPS